MRSRISEKDPYVSFYRVHAVCYFMSMARTSQDNTFSKCDLYLSIPRNIVQDAVRFDSASLENLRLR